MRRNRLKNIINKSKELSNKQQLVGESPFEQFKNSLPKELESFKGDNYRLEAAWKAYGSPKNYEEAVWLGLVNPQIPGKMPSIGYNEESDEYEYLNTGKENDIVAKDIRVWDNDVIPLVKELKLGGFIRVYDEEKDCWKYSKNKPQDVESFKLGGKKKIKIYLEGDSKEGEYIEVDSLDDDQRAGIKPIGKDSKGRNRYLNGDNKAVLNQGGRQNGDIPGFQKGGKPKSYQEWVKTVPQDRLSDNYDLETAYQYLPIEELEKWRTATPEQLKNESYHLRSVAPYGDGDYIFLKKGREWINPEVNGELQQYHLGKTGLQFSHDLIFDEDQNRYFYKKKKGFNPQAFKQGGQMNVIPEGALHARKNNMELAKEGEITHKGVPVIDNDGVQQAEVEKEEWTITKSLTEDVERWSKKFYDKNVPQKEKDEIAIRCGKRICQELLHNTDDRVGLIDQMEEKL